MDLFRLGLVSSRAQYFLLVARLGSIRQAAKATNIAPSSISRAIQQLEEDLGTPLFERVQQRLRLTSAGELLFYRIRQSTSELNRAMTEIDDLSGLRRGTVSVAVIESAARSLLPEVLTEFWVRSPEITVDVTVTGSQEAADMLGAGDVDLALAFDASHPRSVQRIHSVPLSLGVLVRPGSPLIAKENLRSYDLAGERVIIPDSSLTLGASVEQALGGTFMEFSRRMSTNSIALMLRMARRGLGVILQTRFGAERELGRGELVFLPLKDARLQPRRLMLLARSKTEMPEAAEALAAALVRAMGRLPE